MVEGLGARVWGLKALRGWHLKASGLEIERNVQGLKNRLEALLENKVSFTDVRTPFFCSLSFSVNSSGMGVWSLNLEPRTLEP